MKAEATKLPWTFHNISTSRENDGLGYIEGPDGIEIAHHGSNRKSKDENLANAALIVRAVNHFEAVVNCLKDTKVHIDIILNNGRHCNHCGKTGRHSNVCFIGNIVTVLESIESEEQ